MSSIIRTNGKAICGLIGEHLSHSFSPQIHRLLADYPYTLCELPESGLADFFDKTDFTAFNVTIPYKKAVIPFLKGISPAAARIGAVNTVIRRADGFYGDNTDYYGFRYMLTAVGAEVAGKTVLILGTGGASLTVRAVCEDLGAKEIVFVSRSGPIDYENVYAQYENAEIIVNTTPVGMYPNNGKAPITLSRFPRLLCVLDLIYNPARTALLLEAERLDIPSINGLPMLVAQAKRACELFLNTEIDDERIPEIVKSIRTACENLILIGMPGCGKSTAGRILSRMTGKQFVDTDAAIPELSGGRTPAECIREDGEKAFRKIETEAVARIGKESGLIIATGGGVPTVPENLDLLRQNGILLRIDCDLAQLSIAGRPLSQGRSLETLYSERRAAYERFTDAAVDRRESARETAKALLLAFEQIISQ